VRILVIGGTRSIGPRVVRRLVAAGHIVAVFHRGRHDNDLPPGVIGIRDPRAGIPVTDFPPEVFQFKPQLVLHMIAMGARDGAAARDAFENVARRIVMLSSGDVYRAYGCFSNLEPGPVEPAPITEDSPIRSVLHPYRTADTPQDRLEYFYEKILAEREIAASGSLPATILRLPKVYGPADNADLGTVYGFRNRPHWRWTHGYVENVAAAVALAVTSERACGRVFNIGEPETPTVRERLAYLPARPDAPINTMNANFDQNIVYDTNRIRSELDFREVVSERVAMIDVVSRYLAAIQSRPA
jgi:nucleoside-diphosphate-sugar epimerase